MKVEWESLTEDQKEALCRNVLFNPTPYWDKLTSKQRVAAYLSLNVSSSLSCKHLITFFWDGLTESEREGLCHDPRFDPTPFWETLTNWQKIFACENINFNPTKFWNKLTDNQKKVVCEHSKFIFDETE